MIRVPPYVHTDREFVLGLAPRLAIGIPSWRDPQKMIATVRGWITESIEQHGKKTMVFVAETGQGERLGFATVSHSTHFTGEGQAYIGELASARLLSAHGLSGRGRHAGKAIIDTITISSQNWHSAHH